MCLQCPPASGCPSGLLQEYGCSPPWCASGISICPGHVEAESKGPAEGTCPPSSHMGYLAPGLLNTSCQSPPALWGGKRPAVSRSWKGPCFGAASLLPMPMCLFSHV